MKISDLELCVTGLMGSKTAYNLIAISVVQIQGYGLVVIYIS